MVIKIIIIPIISALIGWITNVIAVWMLFNPKQPIKILGYTLQGIFPKRQSAIAQKISEMVIDHLLSKEAIKEQVFTTENINEIKSYIDHKINHYIEEEFSNNYPFLSLFVGKKNREKIRNNMMEQIELNLIDLQDNFIEYVEKKVDLKKIIFDKISALDSSEVNQLMNHILNTELRFIEWVGAVLGFFIGVLQLLILYFL